MVRPAEGKPGNGLVMRQTSGPKPEHTMDYSEVVREAERKSPKASDWRALPSGAWYRVKIVPDDDGNPFDDTDCYGRVENGDRYTRARPHHFGGAARKFRTRQGFVWWQPPDDVTDDKTALDHLAIRVRDYFLEHWRFVGVVVEVERAPCLHCGERKTDASSLWSIESDAGEYLAEVVGDLLADLGEK